MKVKIKRTGVFLLGLISFFSLLTGCTKNGGEVVDGGHGTGIDTETIEATNVKTNTVVLSEDAKLVGFFMTHQGMAMGPYYILRKTDDGWMMKISNEEPDGYRMTEDGEAYDCKGVSGLSPEQEAHYFGFVNTIKDCEHASLVESDDDTVKKLFDAIRACGALGWDGYSVSKSMDGVLDAGDRYRLFALFSDGSTVTVDSYNACPAAWSDLYTKVRDIFEEKADYSQYRIEEFSEENCARMIVEFDDGNLNPTNIFKADINVRSDLGTWSYTIRIKDSDGLYFDKGTDIGLYKEEGIDTLSFGRMLDVLNEYNVQEWDGISGTAPEGNKYMSILVADNDDKTVNANGNNIPDNYDEARDAFVKALIEFYEEHKEQ